MRRVDRSDAFRGWFILSILLYCAQFFASNYQEFTGQMTLDVFDLFDFGQRYNSFTWIMPVIVSIPFATKFCDDWNYRFFHMQIYRTTPKRYAGSKMWYTWLTGGLVSAIGLLLFFGILTLIAELPTPMDTSMGDYAESVFERCGSMGMYLLERSVLSFLHGGFFALSALAFSAFVPYRSLVIAFPMLLQRAYRIFFVAKVPAWMNIDSLGQAGLTYYFTPAQQMLVGLGLFGVFSLVCCVLFYFRVKRRMEHG